MSRHLPKLFFSKLTEPPPPGTVQFFDGYYPELLAGSHTVSLRQKLENFPQTSHSSVNPQHSPEETNAPSYKAPTQVFEVVALQFSIDPDGVDTFYPPKNGQSTYEQILPFIILNDATLPWERSLTPGTPPANEGGSTTPWMALLLLAEDEVILPSGSTSPVTTTTVEALLTSDPQGIVFKPPLTLSQVDKDLRQSSCQTITIPGELFATVLPSVDDLGYLAHCRTTSTADEPGVLQSALLANRLPVTPPGQSQRYFVHLVSLEGFADYLGPSASQQIPTQTSSSQLMQVQLISLYSWSFTCLAEDNASFEKLVTNLIQSEQATSSGSLSLPNPATTVPTEVLTRFENGYVPLTFIAGSGDETFGWYRGPLTATVPQTLPLVGNEQLPILQAPNADSLLMYLSSYGVFDLSYAVAWNIGRQLALADGDFAQKLCRYQNKMHSLTATLVKRSTAPELRGASTAELLNSKLYQDRFLDLIEQGMGRSLTKSLAQPPRKERSFESQARPALSPHDLLCQPEVVTALAQTEPDLQNAIALWLAKLTRLSSLPFSYLVPHPDCLPTSSIRFFYLDQSWIEALCAGALSISVRCAADRAIQTAFLPALMKNVQAQQEALLHRVYPNSPQLSQNLTGVLIRSQLISAWPKMVIKATKAGTPLNIVRDDTLAPDVRLCIFADVPDSVSLAEPYQGILFGIEDNGIVPRNVTGQNIGSPISGQNVSPSYRTVSQSELGGVLEIDTIAQSLIHATGITPSTAFGAGDFALQMVKTPELQSFPTSS